MAYFDEMMARNRPTEPDSEEPDFLTTLLGLQGAGSTMPEPRKLSLLNKLMIMAQDPNPRLSPVAGTARGQLFLRGLVGGANRLGALNASEQGYDVAGRSGAIRSSAGGGYGGLTPNQMASLAMREREYNRQISNDDQTQKNFEATQAATKAWRDSMDADRDEARANTAAQQAFNREMARLNYGLSQQRVGLSRERLGIAKQRLATMQTLVAKWPEELKILFSADMRRLFDKYGEEDSAALDAEMLHLFETYKRQARGIPEVRTGGSSTAGPSAPQAASPAAPGARSTLDILNGTP